LTPINNGVVSESQGTLTPRATVMWSTTAPIGGRVTLEVWDVTDVPVLVQRQYHFYSLPAGSTQQTSSANNALYLPSLDDGDYMVYARVDYMKMGGWVFLNELLNYWEKVSP
jgi:hypothetical protein